MREHFVRCDRQPYAGWWTEQYGTPASTLADCTFWQRGHSYIWIAASGTDPGALARVEGVGIPFLRIAREVWKPTLVAVIDLGVEATRNVIELDGEEVARFLDRETIQFARDDARLASVHRGFVIARFAGVPVGCGLWRRGGLESAVPKGRRLPELNLPLAAER